MNAKSKEHQTAIVTGASSGIGLGITQFDAAMKHFGQVYLLVHNAGRKH